MHGAWWPVLLALASQDALPPEEAAEVERHHQAAKAHFERLEWGEGIAELEAAYRLYPHPKILYSIGAAYFTWGDRCEEALQVFDRFFAECAGCAERERAESYFERVKGGCRARVRIESVPPGAEVTLGGGSLGLTPIEVQLSPGRYELSVALSGYESTAREVTVAGGVALVERFEMVVMAPPPAPKVALLMPIDEEPEGAPVDDIVAWSSAGITVAALASAIGVGVKVQSDLGAEERERLEEVPNKDRIFELREDIRTNAIVVNVMYGVAAVAAGTSVVFFFRSMSSDEVALAPALGPAGIGIAGRF
jgi:hypothetical protein